MNLSFQLYSARNTPLPDALDSVVNAGFSSVEAYRDNFDAGYTFTAGYATQLSS